MENLSKNSFFLLARFGAKAFAKVRRFFLPRKFFGVFFS